MKRLPISIQTFEKVRENNLLYVDKTNFVYELVSQPGYYFISRPRRFGKSMLVSTLKALFEGKKELFKGLFIYDKIAEWKVFPIIHIDFSKVSYKQGSLEFQQTFIEYIKLQANDYNLTLAASNPAIILNEYITKLNKKFKQKVVILVDEYDKPMIDMLGKGQQFEENRDVLSTIYGVMKGLDTLLQFVFLTGVSRFAKVNVFSGMNNLEDISMDSRFSTMIGFTQTEVEFYFQEYIDVLNRQIPLSHTQLMQSIKYWYNGFSFDGKQYLYNPFSLFNLFQKRTFNNYWFSSGTPTFLINLIKKEKALPENLEHIQVYDLSGGTTQSENTSLISLLYQTGYLTIKNVTYDELRPVYTLGYPNYEVQYSFLSHLAAGFASEHETSIQPEISILRKAFLDNRLDIFVKKYESFLADIPSRLHIPKEAYYHSLTYMILRLVGAKPLLEKETDKGRIDAVLELTDKVYIIEFKFATNKRIKHVETLAKKALKQIHDLKYYEPYTGDQRPVFLVGMGFLNRKIAIKTEQLQ